MCAVRKDKEGCYLFDIHMPSDLANLPDGTQYLQAPGRMAGVTKRVHVVVHVIV